jgi:large subunit ribosomal protein L19
MRHSAIEYVESKHLRKELVDFRTGDSVRVHWKVKEGEKERVQAFEGIVIRKKKGNNRSSFTVRKVSFGVGVERIFPLHSPRYEKIEILSRGSVNRNRLFYLRNLKGKASRVDTMDDNTTAATSGTNTTAAKKATKPAGE